MTYYFVANIKINNPADYERYLEQVDEIFSKYKGEYLAVDPDPTILEGKWDYTKFFKKNKEARKILYAYTFASPLPLLTKWKIFTGLESRVLKVKLTKKVKATAKEL